VPKTHLTATIKKGAAPAEVTMVQQRLKDLGFNPGPIDGAYGPNTQQAIWAFEKLVLGTPRADATGKVTDEMWQRMQDNLTISPLRPSGAGTTHVEVYVPQQVMAVFTDDKPVLIAHISTGDQNADGTPAHWCETATYDTDAQGVPLPEPVTKPECADAKTPGGVFRIQRFAEGNHVSPLGGMFNPVYFNYGIAIHGAQNVPLEPASHGCVRINHVLSLTFPDLVSKGDLVYVWAQDGKQPEEYTKRESLPSFNQPDPNDHSSRKPAKYSLKGEATFYDAGYTAMRLPRGTTVIICGAAGCIERVVNDYGPQKPSRIVDLYRPDFFKICGCGSWSGVTNVTVYVY